MTHPDDQEANVAPGINDRFSDPVQLQSLVAHFRRPERELYARRHAIVNACPLSSDMSVVDLGAGTGELTFLLAATVRHVWAVDLFEHFLSHIALSCRERAISNVLTHQCSKRSLGLARECADLVLLCNTYHHLEFPRSVMQSVYHTLKADGILVLIDLHPQDSGPAQHVRGTAEAFSNEIVSCGFERAHVDLDFLQAGYLQRFVKTKKTDNTDNRHER